MNDKEIHDTIENADLDGMRNYISLLLIKLYKENKITDVERIAYEIKILTYDKYQLYKTYEILKGVDV